VLRESNRFAPRRIRREKWANPQYCPLRVISLLCELMVIVPPQGNGPMFGLPCSSSARFQPVIELHQLRSAAVKIFPHFAQSVK
jgi:hypothetical protein